MDVDADRGPANAKSRFWKAAIGVPGLLIAGAAVACACTVIGFFGAYGWLPELTSHFRLQYGAWLALMAAGLVILRKFRAAAVFAVFALVNFAFIAPLYWGGPAAPPAQATKLKLLLINVQTTNQDYDAVRRLIRAEGPDVVALEEVDQRWLAELAQLGDAYPHRLEHPRSDNFGIALLSREAWCAADIVDLSEAGVPSIAATLPLGTRTVTVLFTHPLPPASREYARLRNGQLAAVAAWAKRQQAPVIVMGDLNATPWSPHFRRLLAESGLRDSARGHGLQTTWPTNAWVLRIPIDHCLVSPDLSAWERRVGPDVGSDHFPLIVTVAAANGAAGN